MCQGAAPRSDGRKVVGSDVDTFLQRIRAKVRYQQMVEAGTLRGSAVDIAGAQVPGPIGPWLDLDAQIAVYLRLEPGDPKAPELLHRIEQRHSWLQHGGDIRASLHASSRNARAGSAPRLVDRNGQILEAANTLRNRHPRESPWQIAGRLAPRFELSQKRIAQIIENLWSA